MATTPRTLIQAVAKGEEEEASSSNPTPPPPPAQQQPRRGGAGRITMVEDETPRRIISALATGLDTEERPSASSAASASASAASPGTTTRQRRPRPTDDSLDNNTGNDAKRLIRGVVRDVRTDSREKASPPHQQEDWAPSNDGDESYNPNQADGEEEDDWRVHNEEAAPPLRAVITKVPPGTVHVKHKKPTPRFPPPLASSSRRTDAFATECYHAFKSFLALGAKPNRLADSSTGSALHAVEDAAQAYLKQSVRDYARFARMDQTSTHHLTRERVELLLREQGLLVGELGDAVRRLMDKDDAVRALGLPTSRARASGW